MGIPIKNQVRLCFVLLGFAAELMGGILVIQETYGKVIICFDKINWGKHDYDWCIWGLVELHLCTSILLQTDAPRMKGTKEEVLTCREESSNIVLDSRMCLRSWWTLHAIHRMVKKLRNWWCVYTVFSISTDAVFCTSTPGEVLEIFVHHLVSITSDSRHSFFWIHNLYWMRWFLGFSLWLTNNPAPIMYMGSLSSGKKSSQVLKWFHPQEFSAMFHQQYEFHTDHVVASPPFCINMVLFGDAGWF